MDSPRIFNEFQVKFVIKIGFYYIIFNNVNNLHKSVQKYNYLILKKIYES